MHVLCNMVIKCHISLDASYHHWCLWCHHACMPLGDKSHPTSMYNTSTTDGCAWTQTSMLLSFGSQILLQHITSLLIVYTLRRSGLIDYLQALPTKRFVGTPLF